MATKMIRQNNIAFIVFVVLVVLCLCSCGKVSDLVTPQQEKELSDTKQVHIYLKYSRAIVYVNGEGKEIGDLNLQSISVITFPPGARISIIKLSGESVRVSIKTKRTRTDLVPSDMYVL